MATATAPRDEYTTAAAPRACERCQLPLPLDSAANRRLCDRCRDVRRAITWLNQAAYAIGPHRYYAGVDAAYDHVRDALEELGG